MADLHAEHGLDYMKIVHNVPMIRHIPDRLAIMYLGHIVEEGPAEGIFALQRHPPTASLVQGEPRLTPIGAAPIPL